VVTHKREETGMCRTAEITIRELDRRTNDGIDVRLLWNSRTNRIFVGVDDARDGAAFEFEVEAARALDAFRHPYAYAGHDDRALAA
jgi:hypothetical protein